MGKLNTSDRIRRAYTYFLHRYSINAPFDKKHTQIVLVPLGAVALVTGIVAYSWQGKTLEIELPENINNQLKAVPAARKAETIENSAISIQEVSTRTKVVSFFTYIPKKVWFLIKSRASDVVVLPYKQKTDLQPVELNVHNYKSKVSYLFGRYIKPIFIPKKNQVSILPHSISTAQHKFWVVPISLDIDSSSDISLTDDQVSTSWLPTSSLRSSEIEPAIAEQPKKIRNLYSIIGTIKDKIWTTASAPELNINSPKNEATQDSILHPHDTSQGFSFRSLFPQKITQMSFRRNVESEDARKALSSHNMSDTETLWSKFIQNMDAQLDEEFCIAKQSEEAEEKSKTRFLVLRRVPYPVSDEKKLVETVKTNQQVELKNQTKELTTFEITIRRIKRFFSRKRPFPSQSGSYPVYRPVPIDKTVYQKPKSLSYLLSKLPFSSEKVEATVENGFSADTTEFWSFSPLPSDQDEIEETVSESPAKPTQNPFLGLFKKRGNSEVKILFNNESSPDRTSNLFIASNINARKSQRSSFFNFFSTPPPPEPDEPKSNIFSNLVEKLSVPQIPKLRMFVGAEKETVPISQQTTAISATISKNNLTSVSSSRFLKNIYNKSPSEHNKTVEKEPDDLIGLSNLTFLYHPPPPPVKKDRDALQIIITLPYPKAIFSSLFPTKTRENEVKNVVSVTNSPTLKPKEINQEESLDNPAEYKTWSGKIVSKLINEATNLGSKSNIEVIESSVEPAKVSEKLSNIKALKNRIVQSDFVQENILGKTKGYILTPNEPKPTGFWSHWTEPVESVTIPEVAEDEIPHEKQPVSTGYWYIWTEGKEMLENFIEEHEPITKLVSKVSTSLGIQNKEESIPTPVSYVEDELEGHTERSWKFWKSKPKDEEIEYDVEINEKPSVLREMFSVILDKYEEDGEIRIEDQEPPPESRSTWKGWGLHRKRLDGEKMKPDSEETLPIFEVEHNKMDSIMTNVAELSDSLKGFWYFWSSKPIVEHPQLQLAEASITEKLNRFVNSLYNKITSGNLGGVEESHSQYIAYTHDLNYTPGFDPHDKNNLYGELEESITVEDLEKVDEHDVLEYTETEEIITNKKGFWYIWSSPEEAEDYNREIEVKPTSHWYFWTPRPVEEIPDPPNTGRFSFIKKISMTKIQSTGSLPVVKVAYVPPAAAILPLVEETSKILPNPNINESSTTEFKTSKFRRLFSRNSNIESVETEPSPPGYWYLWSSEPTSPSVDIISKNHHEEEDRIVPESKGFWYFFSSEAIENAETPQSNSKFSSVFKSFKKDAHREIVPAAISNNANESFTSRFKEMSLYMLEEGGVDIAQSISIISSSIEETPAVEPKTSESSFVSFFKKLGKQKSEPLPESVPEEDSFIPWIRQPLLKEDTDTPEISRSLPSIVERFIMHQKPIETVDLVEYHNDSILKSQQMSHQIEQSNPQFINTLLKKPEASYIQPGPGQPLTPIPPSEKNRSPPHVPPSRRISLYTPFITSSTSFQQPREAEEAPSSSTSSSESPEEFPPNQRRGLASLLPFKSNTSRKASLVRNERAQNIANETSWYSVIFPSVFNSKETEPAQVVNPNEHENSSFFSYFSSFPKKLHRGNQNRADDFTPESTSHKEQGILSSILTMFTSEETTFESKDLERSMAGQTREASKEQIISNKETSSTADAISLEKRPSIMNYFSKSEPKVVEQVQLETTERSKLSSLLNIMTPSVFKSRETLPEPVENNEENGPSKFYSFFLSFPEKVNQSNEILTDEFISESTPYAEQGFFSSILSMSTLEETAYESKEFGTKAKSEKAPKGQKKVVVLEKRPSIMKYFSRPSKSEPTVAEQVQLESTRLSKLSSLVNIITPSVLKSRETKLEPVEKSDEHEDSQFFSFFSSFPENLDHGNQMRTDNTINESTPYAVESKELGNAIKTEKASNELISSSTLDTAVLEKKPSIMKYFSKQSTSKSIAAEQEQLQSTGLSKFSSLVNNITPSVLKSKNTKPAPVENSDQHEGSRFFSVFSSFSDNHGSQILKDDSLTVSTPYAKQGIFSSILEVLISEETAVEPKDLGNATKAEKASKGQISSSTLDPAVIEKRPSFMNYFLRQSTSKSIAADQLESTGLTKSSDSITKSTPYVEQGILSSVLGMFTSEETTSESKKLETITKANKASNDKIGSSKINPVVLENRPSIMNYFSRQSRLEPKVAEQIQLESTDRPKLSSLLNVFTPSMFKSKETKPAPVENSDDHEHGQFFSFYSSFPEKLNHSNELTTDDSITESTSYAEQGILSSVLGMFSSEETTVEFKEPGTNVRSKKASKGQFGSSTMDPVVLENRPSIIKYFSRQFASEPIAAEQDQSAERSKLYSLVNRITPSMLKSKETQPELVENTDEHEHSTIFSFFSSFSENLNFSDQMVTDDSIAQSIAYPEQGILSSILELFKSEETSVEAKELGTTPLENKPRIMNYFSRKSKSQPIVAKQVNDESRKPSKFASLDNVPSIFKSREGKPEQEQIPDDKNFSEFLSFFSSFSQKINQALTDDYIADSTPYAKQDVAFSAESKIESKELENFEDQAKKDSNKQIKKKITAETPKAKNVTTISLENKQRRIYFSRESKSQEQLDTPHLSELVNVEKVYKPLPEPSGLSEEYSLFSRAEPEEEIVFSLSEEFRTSELRPPIDKVTKSKGRLKNDSEEQSVLLTETRNRLSVTEKRLSETTQRLSEAVERLSEAEQRLSETEKRLNENASFSNIIDETPDPGGLPANYSVFQSEPTKELQTVNKKKRNKKDPPPPPPSSPPIMTKESTAQNLGDSKTASKRSSNSISAQKYLEIKYAHKILEQNKSKDSIQSSSSKNVSLKSFSGTNSTEKQVYMIDDLNTGDEVPTEKEDKSEDESSENADSPSQDKPPETDFFYMSSVVNGITSIVKYIVGDEIYSTEKPLTDSDNKEKSTIGVNEKDFRPASSFEEQFRKRELRPSQLNPSIIAKGYTLHAASDLKKNVNMHKKSNNNISVTEFLEQKYPQKATSKQSENTLGRNLNKDSDNKLTDSAVPKKVSLKNLFSKASSKSNEIVDVPPVPNIGENSSSTSSSDNDNYDKKSTTSSVSKKLSLKNLYSKASIKSETNQPQFPKTNESTPSTPSPDNEQESDSSYCPSDEESKTSDATDILDVSSKHKLSFPAPESQPDTESIASVMKSIFGENEPKSKDENSQSSGKPDVKENSTFENSPLSPYKSLDNDTERSKEENPGKIRKTGVRKLSNEREEWSLTDITTDDEEEYLLSSEVAYKNNKDKNYSRFMGMSDPRGLPEDLSDFYSRPQLVVEPKSSFFSGWRNTDLRKIPKKEPSIYQENGKLKPWVKKPSGYLTSPIPSNPQLKQTKTSESTPKESPSLVSASSTPNISEPSSKDSFVSKRFENRSAEIESDSKDAKPNIKEPDEKCAFQILDAIDLSKPLIKKKESFNEIMDKKDSINKESEKNDSVKIALSKPDSVHKKGENNNTIIQRSSSMFSVLKTRLGSSSNIFDKSKPPEKFHREYPQINEGYNKKGTDFKIVKTDFDNKENLENETTVYGLKTKFRSSSNIIDKSKPLLHSHTDHKNVNKTASDHKENLKNETIIKKSSEILNGLKTRFESTSTIIDKSKPSIDPIDPKSVNKTDSDHKEKLENEAILQKSSSNFCVLKTRFGSSSNIVNKSKPPKDSVHVEYPPRRSQQDIYKRNSREDLTRISVGQDSVSRNSQRNLSPSKESESLQKLPSINNSDTTPGNESYKIKRIWHHEHKVKEPLPENNCEYHHFTSPVSALLPEIPSTPPSVKRNISLEESALLKTQAPIIHQSERSNVVKPEDSKLLSASSEPLKKSASKSSMQSKEIEKTLTENNMSAKNTNEQNLAESLLPLLLKSSKTEASKSSDPPSTISYFSEYLSKISTRFRSTSSSKKDD